MEIPTERMSQKKTLITLAIGSCSHYPHGSSLPPCNYYRWVITTPMGHLMRILLHLSICLSLPSFELHFQIFQTFEGLSRGVARWISRLLSPRPTPPGPLAGVKRKKTSSGYPAIYSYLLIQRTISILLSAMPCWLLFSLIRCHQNLLIQWIIYIYFLQVYERCYLS